MADNFSLLSFLADRSLRKAQDTYVPGGSGGFTSKYSTIENRDLTYPPIDVNPSSNYPQVDNRTMLDAAIRANDTALMKEITLNKNKVDYHYGMGASDWLTKNFHQFTPDERLRVLYSIQNAPAPPISGVPVPNNSYPEQKQQSPIIGQRG